MANTKKSQLGKELKFFEKNKKNYLKQYKNLFVLIKEEEFGGAYTNEQEAYKNGIEKYGNVAFLIKQVTEKEAEVNFPALTVGLINVNI